MAQGVAFITGAAKRIGREIALHLARNGWDIAVHYRHSKAEAAELVTMIQAMGRGAAAIQGDLCIADDAARMMEEASAMLGTITALIHNASIFERDDLATVSTESFALHMTVNVQSPLMLTQAFVAQLPDDSAGAVIALSDGLRGWSLSESFLSYSLSKLALEQMMVLLAPALAPRVRINTVALGATMQNVQDLPETFDKIKALTPLQRTTDVTDVCQVISYLLSAPMVTGQTIDITGGFALKRNLV
jgi:NAD(P)-dependent dehydrogenase (short-subunit alcohol dehydrogenase family)